MDNSSSSNNVLQDRVMIIWVLLPLYITYTNVIYSHLYIASHKKVAMTVTIVVATIVFAMVTRQESLICCSVHGSSS